MTDTMPPQQSSATGQKPPKQEQLLATEEIVEVGPGVLRAQLPIDMPGLGHVNCYILEDERGVALVDPGLPGEPSWKALVRRLGDAGIPLKRVHTAIITHSHPDHFGGAGQLRAETGCDILTHESFIAWWEFNTDEMVELDLANDGAGEKPETEWPTWSDVTPWGAPTEWAKSRRNEHLQDILRFRRTAAPTRRVRDQEPVRLARREWVSVHTPGHTADHLCLFDPEGGVMLSGDHVLPTITPHIGGMGQQKDALKSFFASLELMRSFDGVKVVLPAHGLPFYDLHGRVSAIEQHHAERLERLRHASAELDREATVEELSHYLFAPRAWGLMAESECYAHLEHLRELGEATSTSREGLLWYRVHPEA